MTTPYHNPLLDSELFNIYEFTKNQNDSTNIPGYFVISTAPIDVDNRKEQLNIPNNKDIFNVVKDEPEASAEIMLGRVADDLLKVKSESPELVIAVHGYNNKFSSTERWYETIYDYINKHIKIDASKKYVFLGYRWPSEGLFGDNWWAIFVRVFDALFRALPVMPAVIFFFSLVVCASLVTLGLKFINKLVINAASTFQTDIPPVSAAYWAFIVFLAFFGILFSIVLTLVGLRLVVYFRDTYRATRFGVPDLVELIRQIDKSTFEIKLLEKWDEVKDLLMEIGTTEEDWIKANTDRKREIWEKIDRHKRTKIEEENRGIIENKIKLTFIGHSLGCLVITDAIRVLSDVFDPNSIGNLNKVNTEKQPSPEIGRVFSLGRLVLVAPDIPMETIMPRRANFLRSALRRFDEAYIFSNEGDMALRLASTIANYFSFPAVTRFSGYRLGNVTVKHFKYENDKKDSSGEPPSYGIINRELQTNGTLCIKYPYKCLEIRSSNWEHVNLEGIREFSYKSEKVCFGEHRLPLHNQDEKTIVEKPIADLFTYFDCTDYKDEDNKPGVVSYALGKPALNLFWDYILLTIAFFFLGKDTHGGYFEGDFSKRTMYNLAFLGFKEFLKSYGGSTKQEQLENFSKECKNKQMQVILAPERYEVDILGGKRDRSGY